MDNYSIRLNEDYELSTETLKSEVKLASLISLFLLSLVGLAGTVVILYFYINNLVTGIDPSIRIGVAIIASVSIYILGALGGLFWQRLGLFIAGNTYRVYLDKMHPKFFKIFGELYMKFVGPDKLIYLEGEALDPNFRNIIYRLKFVLRIGISQLGFFVVGLTFIFNPLFNTIEKLVTSPFLDNFGQELQILLSIAFGVCGVGIYLPASFIIKDSNIRTWDAKNRIIDQPLSTLRNRIDSLIGFGAVLSGWEFYQGFITNKLLVLNTIFPKLEPTFMLTILDYFLLLIVITILSAPIIYPAAVTYTFRHQKNVNQFRSRSINAGVHVGVSKIREPSETELGNISSYVTSSMS